MELTDADINALADNIDTLSEHELTLLVEQLTEMERRKTQAHLQSDFLAFCLHMETGYLVGRHHKILAAELTSMEAGLNDRLCVSVPPRHGKSLMISTLFPAWFLGRNPTLQVMLVSHTTDLAVDFGRKVRNLISSPRYAEVFPDVALAKDSKSAGRWNTNHGGVFYATGVGSALAGRGADLLLIDDPHSEQDILSGNLDVFDHAYQWFAYGARTRLMPQGRVAVVATRWSMSDLIGRLTEDMVKNSEADQYKIVELPAIFEKEEPDDEGGTRTVETPLWPEFFDLEALHRTRASMPSFQWNAQYQQNPTSEESSLVKREWWMRWTKPRPPVCEFVISSLDSAAEAHNRADYTALTTWGVFVNEDTGVYNLILLHSLKERLEFPELKQRCLDHYREWEPDAFIVEKKSSGVAIYQELRRTGVPVQEYTPHRGTGDKYARLASVADIVASGMVWAPETRWADELIEEVASFPYAKHDDLTDSTVYALMRFRQGGFLSLPSDYEDDDVSHLRVAAYY